MSSKAIGGDRKQVEDVFKTQNTIEFSFMKSMLMEIN